MFRLLWNHLRQAINWRFFAAVAAAAAFLLASSFCFLTQYKPDTIDSSIIMVEMLIQSAGIDTLLLFFLPTLAYAGSYYTDEESRSLLYWTIRTGSNSYTASKVITTAISGFLILFLGEALYILIMRGIGFLFYNPFGDYNNGNPFQSLIVDGKIFLFYLYKMTYRSLSGSITAVFGLFVSSFWPMPYTAYSIPLTFYYFMGRFTVEQLGDSILNPWYWLSFAMAVSNTDATGVLVGKILITFAVCFLMGCLFSERVKGRLACV